MTVYDVKNTQFIWRGVTLTGTGDSHAYNVTQKNDSFTYSISLPSYITTDVNEGDKIGQIKIVTNNQEKIIDIIAKDTVKIKKTSRRFF